MLKKRTPVLRRRRVLVGGGVGLVLVVLAAFLTGRAISDSTTGDAARDYVSGEPMPRGDLPGWRQTFSDDFNTGALDEDRWGRYSGTPGGSPQSHWEGDHVVVRDSQLVLEGYQEEGRWVTGGVSNWPVTQLYGKWEVRFRVDPSDETTFHFLLWPQADVWPPEIDFLENFGGGRQSASAFLHYRDESEPNGRGKTERTVEADFTTWHTAGVEWLPGEVTYTLDGEPWASVTGENVPDQPMWLGLQAQAVDCSSGDNCTDGITRADVMIDWVTVYERD
ncbi:glycoside hydrolase family 16 protein [Nakamurella deserti]|uniref:glycoside hydrolase family 16 protein n=1 Tax=Nakamurella deserti TaxID=2164074 RepID=UPI0013002E84|nr:glycoside hydrolase family 16 protein [Nakamurella deserti]